MGRKRSLSGPRLCVTGALLIAIVPPALGAGQWQAGAPMPSARTEVAVAALVGKI